MTTIGQPIPSPVNLKNGTDNWYFCRPKYCPTCTRCSIKTIAVEAEDIKNYQQFH
jgi:hypothetical protein